MQLAGTPQRARVGARFALLCLSACGQQDPNAPFDVDPAGRGSAKSSAEASAAGVGGSGAGSVVLGGPASGEEGRAGTAADDPLRAGAGNAGAPSTTGGKPADYYPLADGANWVYQHSGGSMPWEEVVTLSATQFQGATAYLLSDTAGPSGARSESVLVSTGSEVWRVHKDVYENDTLTSQVTYDPGFLRFDAAWAEMALGDKQTRQYLRTAVDATNMPMAQGDRSHAFTVAGRDQEVTVPAGTFQGCLEILRERIRQPAETTLGGDTKRFWFCPGVGKVKELEPDVGKLEVLLSCKVPQGGCQR